jgi:hypothetical protein
LFHCTGFMNAQNTHHQDAKSSHQYMKSHFMTKKWVCDAQLVIGE